MVKTYCSTRWAVCAEIVRAGLTSPTGVFFGCKSRNYLRHDGPENVMAFSPTRLGKGVDLVARESGPVQP
jgi:type IV secretion system protein VirD4